jgi:hypothetical protein
MLNPNLKMKLRLSPNIFLEIQFLFFGIFNNFYYILLESTIVYLSDRLKSLFHVEMNIRNSKIVVRMLYTNNFVQLHNKYVKINVWFDLCCIISFCKSFICNWKQSPFNKVSTTVSQHVLWQLSCISFLHGGNIVEPFPMFVAHCAQIHREEDQVGI